MTRQRFDFAPGRIPSPSTPSPPHSSASLLATPPSVYSSLPRRPPLAPRASSAASTSPDVRIGILSIPIPSASNTNPPSKSHTYSLALSRRSVLKLKRGGARPSTRRRSPLADSLPSYSDHDSSHRSNETWNSQEKSHIKAQFLRTHSVIGDETLKMMRGEKIEYNPTPLYHIWQASAESSTSCNTSESCSSMPTTSSHSSNFQSEKFDFLPADINILHACLREEPDDDLHDPGPLLPRKGINRLIVEPIGWSGPSNYLSGRGWLNSLGLGCVVIALLTLFPGYPVIAYITRDTVSSFGAFNEGGVNSTGQVPHINGFRGMIDKDTPAAAMTKLGTNGKKYNLVFSDEFELDGRTFWEGDDPYWTAVDLHYWGTRNLEWYDPDMIKTVNGSLELTLQPADAATNHNLNFTGGMLQSWNKFCFTGGIIEIRASLPGNPDVPGLWPAAWTMGNLGRAGYGASTDGTWPYSYDSCDVGTLQNQTNPTTGEPSLLDTGGDPYHHGRFSYQPGQKLSACTCAGEDHPGPRRNGEFVGRSAPEIDIFETTVTGTGSRSTGSLSQSAQFAPFDDHYRLNNLTEGNIEINHDNSYGTLANAYLGGVYQQAASAFSKTDQSAYSGEAYNTYGYEYATSDSPDPFITWTQGDEDTWTLRPEAVGPNPVSGVGQRLISVEPMYIILNLGISYGFGTIDFNRLDPLFPVKMLVDYVRVYQPADEVPNTTCDPPNYPTQDYINKHVDAYTNNNLTTWAQYTGGNNHDFPKNRLTATC